MILSYESGNEDMMDWPMAMFLTWIALAVIAKMHLKAI